jgi:hypothetical protein
METYTAIKKCKTTKSVLLIVLIILLSYPSFSQSLYEKAGGIKTDFRILSDTVDLTILAQGLIERGFFDYESSENYSYAYGMQVWFLEFVTTNNLQWIYQPRKHGIFGRNFCKIILLDESNNQLMTTDVPSNYIQEVSNENGLQTFSVNLYKVPLVLLDKTVTIKLRRITNFRN